MTLESAREYTEWSTKRPQMSVCNVCWGSHGCDLPLGHPGQHMCDCCNPEHAATHVEADENSYGHDGCAGTWPYYGRKAMAGTEAGLPFFDYVDFAHLPDEFDRLSREPRSPVSPSQAHNKYL